jgi:hypothetical protein
MPRFIKGTLFESAKTEINILMRRYLFLLLLLVATSCGQKSETTTTTDSTGAVVNAPDDQGTGTPSDEANLPPDGSAPGVTPDNNPVVNPPDGSGSNPPKPQPTGNIRVSSPQPNDYVNADQFQIVGTARTFENNVVYRVRDLASNQIIATGFGTATGEMGQFSPFTITVKPKKGGGVQYPTRALIEVFENSAKDGSEINMVQIPVRIGVGADEPNAIEVFFSNAQKGSNTDCHRVFSLPRSIPQTQALATVAMNRLLAGPTSEERAQGYSTQIPAGTKLNRITIESGVARVDFSQEMATAAGACRVTAIRSQIERTLRQFSTVKNVAITVNGKSDVLEP